MMELLQVLSLLLVVEGLLPALAPAAFRNALLLMAEMDERSLRRSGLISMVLGALFLYLLQTN